MSTQPAPILHDLSATRAIVQEYAREAVAFRRLLTVGSNDTLCLEPDAIAAQQLALRAFEELRAVEQGCGQENGDCLCPCHLT